MTLWPVQTLGGEINSVAISGNGRVVIAGTFYHSGPVPAKLGTYAYDMVGNILWKDLSVPSTGDNGVYWVAVSRDGQWAASGGGNHVYPPPKTLGVGYVTTYQVASGNKSVALSANIGGVNMVALSGDGGYLVAGADAAYVFVRQSGVFVNPMPLKYLIAAGDTVSAVAISDDGRWIVYGTSSGQVVLYPNKAIVPPLTVPVGWSAPSNHYIKSVAMAADGSGFAVVSTNRAYATLTGTKVVCNAYIFSLDSNGAHYFPTTKIPAWPPFLLAGCNGTLSVAMSDNGSRAAAVGNVGHRDGSVSGSVFFFDALSGVQLWMKPTQHGPNCVSLDAAGQYVAVADGFLSSGAFYLFDAIGNTLPISGLLANQPGAAVSWTIQIAADGTAITAGSDDSKVYYYDGPVPRPKPPVMNPPIIL